MRNIIQKMDIFGIWMDGWIHTDLRMAELEWVAAMEMVCKDSDITDK